MEDLLAKAGSQVVTLAIRSGITVASRFAIKTVSRFLDNIPDDDKNPELEEQNSSKKSLEKLKIALFTRIQIITPAIDLIQLLAARGNTSLMSTIRLTRSLRRDIAQFDSKVQLAAETYNSSTENVLNLSESDVRSNENNAIKAVKEYMNDLLSRIEDSIPLITLALTTSGANLSATLPDTVSPGRLLQASRMLWMGDIKYKESYNDFILKENNHISTSPNSNFTPSISIQIGPKFSLKLFTLFTGSAQTIQWQEKFPKLFAYIVRVGPSSSPMVNSKFVTTHNNTPLITGGSQYSYSYDYKLILEQDIKDGRVHDLDHHSDNIWYPPDTEPGSPGKRIISVENITRLFFSASSSILLIDDQSEPVLVLKLNSVISKLFNQDFSSDIKKNTNEFRDPLENNFNDSYYNNDFGLDEDDLLSEDQYYNESYIAREMQKPENNEWIALQAYTTEDVLSEDEFDDDEDDDDEFNEDDFEKEENYNDELDDDSNTQSDEDEYASSNRKIKKKSTILDNDTNNSLVQALQNISLQPNTTSTPIEQKIRKTSNIEVKSNKNLLLQSNSDYFSSSVSTSLSLLEYLLRLCALQMNDQADLCSITDERIALYLRDENANNSQTQQTRKHSVTNFNSVGTAPVTGSDAASVSLGSINPSVSHNNLRNSSYSRNTPIQQQRRNQQNYQSILEKNTSYDKSFNKNHLINNSRSSPLEENSSFHSFELDENPSSSFSMSLTPTHLSRNRRISNDNEIINNDIIDNKNNRSKESRHGKSLENRKKNKNKLNLDEINVTVSKTEREIKNNNSNRVEEGLQGNGNILIKNENSDNWPRRRSARLSGKLNTKKINSSLADSGEFMGSKEYTNFTNSGESTRITRSARITDDKKNNKNNDNFMLKGFETPISKKTESGHKKNSGKNNTISMNDEKEGNVEKSDENSTQLTPWEIDRIRNGSPVKSTASRQLYKR